MDEDKEVEGMMADLALSLSEKSKQNKGKIMWKKNNPNKVGFALA